MNRKTSRQIGVGGGSPKKNVGPDHGSHDRHRKGKAKKIPEGMYPRIKKKKPSKKRD